MHELRHKIFDNDQVRPIGYFLPLQTGWLFDNSPRKFCVKGRQLGWSDITALRALVLLAFANQRLNTWASSRDQIQAELLVEDVSKWCNLICQGSDDRAASSALFPKNLIKSISQDCLTFTNGNRFHSLSSNPDAQAGKRGHRILDEFALHEQQEKLLSIALPGADWGGGIEIFSTPRGSENLFHRLQMEIEHNGNPKKFSYHKVTLQKMLEQGLLYKIQCALPEDHPVQQMDEAEYFDFKRAESIDQETFNQEYMCIPSDEQTAFLTYDLITGAEYAPGLDWETPANPADAELYVGVDIGRDRDLTVIHVLEKVSTVYHTRGIQVLEKEPFDVQEKCLYELLELPQVKRCCIDQTGIGRQFTERAQQKFGKYKVEGITFTNAVKEELAIPVRMAFEDRTIKIPGDPVLRADLRAIKKEPTVTGNIRFTADRSPSGHADRFWALALALHATKRKKQPLEITVGW